MFNPMEIRNVGTNTILLEMYPPQKRLSEMMVTVFQELYGS